MSEAGDQRSRKRVTTIVAQKKAATGNYSSQHQNVEFANRHYIVVVIEPNSTAGVFNVRAEPAGIGIVGNTGFAKIEIENVNIATATTMTFEVAGFFDAFMLQITAAITGGSAPGISVFVNSTVLFGT
jgi:hypothetical protein